MKTNALSFGFFLIVLSGALYFWGALVEGFFYIPIAIILLFVLSEAVKRLPLVVWLLVGFAFMTVLFVPDAKMARMFPTDSLNSTAQVAYLLTITPTLMVAALLLAAGLRGLAATVAPKSKRWLATAVFCLGLLLIVKAVNSFYWFIVWETTGDSLAYLWLFFPSIGLLVAGFVILNTLAKKQKLFGVGYVLLLLTTLFGVAAAARQVDYRALTAQRADEIVAALGRYHVWNGHYPLDLSELSPRYILSIPQPFIIYGQAWCYESNESTYRLSYVDRDHWIDPRLFGRVHIAAMPPPDIPALSRPCAAEIAAIRSRYPSQPYVYR